jgi:hypothetical protein
MAKNFEKLIFGGLHEKHAVQRGIWVPTQHSLWDRRCSSLYRFGTDRTENIVHNSSSVVSRYHRSNRAGSTIVLF